MADFDWGSLAGGLASGAATAFLGPAGGAAVNALTPLITGLFTGNQAEKDANTKKQAEDMASIEAQAKQKLGMTGGSPLAGGNIPSLNPNSTIGKITGSLGGTTGITQLLQQLLGN